MGQTVGIGIIHRNDPGRANTDQVLINLTQADQVTSSEVEQVPTRNSGKQAVRVVSTGNGAQKGGVKPRRQIEYNSAQREKQQQPPTSRQQCQPSISAYNNYNNRKNYSNNI